MAAGVQANPKDPLECVSAAAAAPSRWSVVVGVPWVRCTKAEVPVDDLAFIRRPRYVK